MLKSKLKLINFRRCHRNQFFINFKLEQTKKKCERCGNELEINDLVIHHKTYDHECAFTESIELKRKVVRRGRIININPTVPDCEKCYYSNKESFLKCQELTQIVHNTCHFKLHLQNPKSIVSRIASTNSKKEGFTKTTSNKDFSNIKELLLKASSKNDFINSLRSCGYEFYLRGNTPGVERIEDCRRYRLKTIGLFEIYTQALAKWGIG